MGESKLSAFREIYYPENLYYRCVVTLQADTLGGILTKAIHQTRVY